MSELTNTTKISKPTSKIWYVVFNESRSEVITYGSILPTQVLETKHSQVDTYEIESEWLEILGQNNIELETELEIELETEIESLN